MMVVMVGALFATHQARAKVLAGTAGDDTLVGTDRADRLDGRDGEDSLKGRRGAYRLQGSLGEDHLKGNRGNDHLWGSRGNDKIFPGDGNDKVYAGYSDDLIYARDTDRVDYIDCGPGFDKVETIHRDDETLSNCERALQRVAMRMGCMASWADESLFQRPPSEDRGCHRKRNAQGSGRSHLRSRDLHRQALRHQGPKRRIS